MAPCVEGSEAQSSEALPVRGGWLMGPRADLPLQAVSLALPRGMS